MNYDLHHQVVQRLKADYGLKPAAGQWLRGGTCPACGKRELYTHAEHPWLVRCGRQSKCGSEYHVKDLYDDLFDDWSKRAPASEQQPTASARAYLEFSRGFRLELIEGWFTQENYFDREANAGSATVRFPMEGNGYWERLIDRPHRFGKKKARFMPGYSYRGKWWCPPCVDLLEVDELWLVEGIFDAIALLHHGIAAVSVMSSNGYPEEKLRELKARRGDSLPTLVWALDNEPGARAYTRKHVRKARELGYRCEAAQIPQRAGKKTDWNDLHQRWMFEGDEEERAAKVERDLEEARHQGALLLAENASEKGVLMYDWDECNEFHFGFDNRLYWFKLDLDKFHKAKQRLMESDSHEDRLLNERQIRDKALRECGAVVRLANCYPQALYYMRNEVTDESWYYFRIDFPHDGGSVKNTFTAAQVAAANEFKKRLLGIAAGAIYTGTGQQLDRIMESQLGRLKTVKTIDFIGYAKEHGCYVFNDVAVKDGQVFSLNEEDFFDMGRLSIKSQSQSPILSINTDLHAYREEWLELLWRCFGAKGLVVLAFWFGSLFAEQIRQRQKSYPFLEVVGEAGAGKSTLIEFLWKLFGRLEYEGFDPTKSTPASRARNFAQVGNMPVVLIESEREKVDGAPTKQYDWDELKTAYNGRSVRSTGVKNNGNDTREPPFRGALVVSQNHAVNASEPILQRIVHVSMTSQSHTPASKAMAEKLERMPVDQVSGFMLKALAQEARVLEVVTDQAPVYEQQLLELPEIRTVRIAKNHSQLYALVDALAEVLPLTGEQIAAAHAEVCAMAIARQQAINADHPQVVEFWELYDFLNGQDEKGALNHARREGVIAVNLNEFAEMAANKRQQVPPLTELKRLLKTSKHPKFIEANKVVNSCRMLDAFDKPKTLRCWLFQET